MVTASARLVTWFSHVLRFPGPLGQRSTLGGMRSKRWKLSRTVVAAFTRTGGKAKRSWLATRYQACQKLKFRVVCLSVRRGAAVA